jgi:hypothetical protein
MAIVLDGTTGITNDGGYTGDGVVFADTTPANTLVTTTGGNVGIGTSSPTARIHVSAPDGTAPMTLNTAGGSDSTRALNFNVAGDNYGKILVPSASGGAMAFWTGSANAAAERARIDTSGKLLVNTSSALLAGNLQVNATGTDGAITSKSSEWSTYTQYIWNATTTDNSRFVSFGTQGTYTERGSIDYNRGSNVTRFITTSDATLKNIIGDHNGQRSREILNTTRIREFAWKADSDQKPQIGVIAQELHETFKGAVSVGGENAQGDYTPWGVDKTAFTFHLIAGWQAHEKIIQEQQAIILAQQNALTALTARVEALEGTQP